MAWSLDARIPVTLCADRAGLAAALAEGAPAALLGPPGFEAPEGAVAGADLAPGAGPHVAACACCQGRGTAALALDQLFQSRARGLCPWFARVLVLDEAGLGAEVAAALRQDVLSAARFRLA